MKLAIISDMHFGFDGNILVRPSGTGYIVDAGVNSYYRKMLDAFGDIECEGYRLDYLVLLGDILDFSISPYDKAYKIARVFFQKLRSDNVAKNYIYIPGNHDCDIWHTVEHQVNIVNTVAKGQEPRDFKHSVDRKSVV